MRLFTTIFVLALALLATGHARAEEIVLTGKTFSPNRAEIFSPHALEVQPSTVSAGSEVLFSPFTQMKVSKLLTEIGQKVTADQCLLEFDYPHEGLIAERRKLSQTGLMIQEVRLEQVRSEISTLRASLAGAQALRQKGVVSSQQVTDLERTLQVKTLEAQALAAKAELERGVAEGGLETARKKFGKVVDEHSLSGRSWITSPVPGFVLWVNPDLKPGMVVAKKTRLFVVGSLDPILFKADVYEDRAIRLRAGDKARVTFEALPGKTFEGAVSRVAVTPLSGDVLTPSQYEVELSLPNPGLILKEGVRGEATVQVPDGR